ncbi:isocitrate lyase/phosphoenolpyruvate mutase family protein [Nonomuraea sp. NPDC050153]|uniref:isocitrate lyase/phosphoenolpyruvate mutase family protein n=1 Tax=Nonomuraea sp. NPDC050153 TaxID=3364359 RepID=UPI00378FD74C
MTPTTVTRAARFRALHQGTVLVLPNAWDAASAALIEAAGARAAYACAARAAGELLGGGTYETLAGGLDYGRLNSLLGGRP